MKKSVTLKFKGGKVVIETDGFTGPACERATEQIEKALGIVNTKVQKPEYYAPENTESDQVKVGRWL